MSFSYTIDRDTFGKLKAKTEEGIEVRVNGAEVTGYYVQVMTYRGGRGVNSTARVYRTDGAFSTTDLFGDWHETLVEDRAARGTEKTIRAMHERALDLLPAALERAKAHTAAKVLKEQRKPVEPELTPEQAQAAMADFNHPANPAHY